MENENKFRPRGKDILMLLLEHGPLSFSAISKMLNPKMKKKRLRECLRILKHKEYISPRIVGDMKTFYRISQRESNRKRTAKYLNCLPDDLLQPTFQHQNWMHRECCEYWIYLVSLAFPDAEVIREAKFYDNEVAQRIMLIDRKDFELRPDFLLIFPKTNKSERLAIAFEVERVRKSNRRMLAKLSKYTNKTMVDGLIYVCESDKLAETIRLTYKNKVAQRARRIKHYAENFFLFSATINAKDSQFQLYNSEQKAVSIASWINYLKSTKRNFRRDQNFSQSGYPTLAF